MKPVWLLQTMLTHSKLFLACGIIDSCACLCHAQKTVDWKVSEGNVQGVPLRLETWKTETAEAAVNKNTKMIKWQKF